jgi:hypothetical protein
MAAAHYRQSVIAQLVPVLSATLTEAIRDKYEELAQAS